MSAKCTHESVSKKGTQILSKYRILREVDQGFSHIFQTQESSNIYAKNSVSEYLIIQLFPTNDYTHKLVLSSCIFITKYFAMPVYLVHSCNSIIFGHS